MPDTPFSDRRDFLLGLSSLMLASTVPPLAASAAPSPTPLGTSGAPFRVDIHQHIVPPVYRDALARASVTAIGGVPFPEWSEARMFEQMDRGGIQQAVLSLSAPGVYFGDAAFARDLARQCNDAMAELITRTPHRLGGFATLPLPATDDALVELERAFDSLKLDGVVLLTNYDDLYLGDPIYEPLMQELNRRKAVVFVHPTLASSATDLKLALPAPILEFVFDTTRAGSNLIFSGALDRYPDIRFILAHMGGTLPYVAWRLRLIEKSPRKVYAEFRERSGRSVTDYLGQFYYDTALSGAPYALDSVLNIVGPDRLLFGSDLPFAPEAFALETTAELDAYDRFDATAHQEINYKNARRLLPRLQKAAK